MSVTNENKLEESYPNGLTPSSLNNQSISFVIPIYQRLFEWNKEQISQLLDDLFVAYNKNPEKRYYIGILTAIKHESNKYSLVDGQQRFVVLTLIGLVLRKYCPDWNSFLTIDDENIRLSFAARDEDYEYLTSLIFENDNVKQENRKMKDGIECIKKWISEKYKYCFDCSTESCAFSGLSKFAKYVFKNTTFFITELPKEAYNNGQKLNKYFERMNSSGKDLEQHEILKVKCLNKLEENRKNNNQILKPVFATHIWNIVSQMNKPLIRKKEKEESKTTYERYIKCIKQLVLSKPGWEEIIFKNLNDNYLDINKPSNTFEEESYHFCHSMLSFNEFLLQVLWLSLEESIQKQQTIIEFFDTNKLLSTYNKITENFKDQQCTDNNWDWNKFFVDLLLYRLIYDLYVIRIPKPSKYDSLAIDNEHDFNLEYLVKYDDTFIRRRLTQYQSMLYAGSFSKTYYLWLVPYLNFIREAFAKEQGYQPNCKELNCTELLNFLKSKDNENHKKFDSSKLNYQDRPLYWLRRLDYYLWEANEDNEKDKDKAISAFRFRKGGLSIEHVHPQNQTNQVDEWEKENIHSFGNLALISSSFNSTQGNDSVKVKFARIADRAQKENIESIKLYYIYKKCERSVDNWNQKRMTEHETEMINILNNSLNPK